MAYDDGFTEADLIAPSEELNVNRTVVVFPAPVTLHEVVVPTFMISIFAHVTCAPDSP